MKALIVGGGIAGLFLYHALRREGIAAEVFEKVPRFNHVGGGLILKSPATLSLQQNGLLAAAQAHGLPLRRHEMLDEQGASLGEIDFEPLYAQGLTPGLLIHRAAFHDVLQSVVAPEDLHLGSPVEAFEVGPDGVSLQAGGRTVEGDLLVGADGLHSRVRERHFQIAAHPLNFRSYRWVVPNTVGADHFMEFMGQGMALGLLPVSREELFLWLSVHARPGQPTATADLPAFQALVARFSHPLVLASLEHLTDPDMVLCTDIHEVTMEEYYSGRCVLLGDSAHAMSPSMGTGSAMAMGDALILARELGKVRRGEEELPAALDSYYRHRFPKVEAMRSLTRSNDADHHAGDLSIVRYRDARLKAWLHDGQAAADLARSLGGEL